MDTPLVAIPRAALMDLVSGIGALTTIWDGEPQPTLGAGGSWATLNISAYGGKGTDETRTDYDETSDQVATSTNGLRRFTLSIRVDSYAFDTPAYETLETIRRRLRGGAARQLMQAEGFALIDTHPITDLSKVVDNRPVFSSVMDVRFSFAVSESEPSFTGDYIASTGTTPAVPGTLTS